MYQFDPRDETAAADVANQLILAGQVIEVPAPQSDPADRLLDHEPAAAQDSSGDERIPMPALTFALQPNRSAVGVRAGGPDRRVALS